MRFAPGDVVNSRYNRGFYYVVQWTDPQFETLFVSLLNDHTAETIETDDVPFRNRCVISFGGVVNCHDE